MDQRTDKESLGTLTRRGDRWTLVFTRRLAHSRDKVWRAVTEPEHLAVWFPQRIVGDRLAGGAAPLRKLGRRQLRRPAAGMRPAYDHGVQLGY